MSQELRLPDHSEGSSASQDAETPTHETRAVRRKTRLWYTHGMDSRDSRNEDSHGMHERFTSPPLHGAGETAASMLPLTEETLQTLVESLPVAIVAVDADGMILYANRKLVELFGYGHDELVGATLEVLIPQRLRSIHTQHRRDYDRKPHSRPMGSGMDLLAVRKDGTEFPIEAGLSNVNLAGKPVTLSSVVDISRRKHNEEMLEQRVEERTREIERRRRVAESLRDIISLLNSNRPLPTVLNHIAAQAGTLLDADAAAIYHLEENRTPIAVLASYGLPNDLRRDNYRLLIDNLPAASAPALPVNGAGSERTVDAVNRHYQAQLAIPLTAQEEVFGGLMLYYTAPRKYSSEEIALAVTFGEQIKLAIENDRLRASAEEAAVAAERNRIARDLHDSVSQTLFSASLIAEVLPRLWSRDHEESLRRLEELKVLTRGALAEMRSLLLELRPSALIEVEIGELLRQLTEAASARARIPVALRIEGASPLPQEVKIACYHIAQEALNNVIKHARARQAEVCLRLEPDLVDLEIRDDGHGFVHHEVTPEHLGLTIMGERADGVGGSLQVISAPGEGTSIRFIWESHLIDQETSRR